MSAADLTVARELADQERRLCAEFGEAIGPDTVRFHLERAREAFAGARIKQFVPVFVYRAARDELLRLHAAERRTALR